MPRWEKFTTCRVCKEKPVEWWGGRCRACFNERIMVQHQCLLARKAGLTCDLTHEQWREIVKTFNGLCAYCLQKPYEALEHFIPIKLGGGTTITNCVPACRECNDRKYDKHPNCVTRISRADIERVHGYLESLKNSS